MTGIPSIVAGPLRHTRCLSCFFGEGTQTLLASSVATKAAHETRRWCGRRRDAGNWFPQELREGRVHRVLKLAHHREASSFARRHQSIVTEHDVGVLGGSDGRLLGTAGSYTASTNFNLFSRQQMVTLPVFAYQSFGARVCLPNQAMVSWGTALVLLMIVSWYLNLGNATVHTSSREVHS